MPKLKIIINPNPILRKKSKEVEIKEISKKKFQNFVKDMTKTMLECDGIGLAAPQVAKNLRLIVINTKEGQQVMINPKITKKSWRKEWGAEACLSVPNLTGKVLRNNKIKCIYLDNKAKINHIDAQGLMARVIQHEIDHLDGILFIDKAKDIQSMD